MKEITALSFDAEDLQPDWLATIHLCVGLPCKHRVINLSSKGTPNMWVVCVGAQSNRNCQNLLLAMAMVDLCK